jgi:predicted XRE-type DNA-binding protein
VFADLGFNDAAERQARLRLAYALNREVEARKLSSASAAKLLRITQSKVFPLRHYKLAGFSLGRLSTMLAALDRDVQP